TTVVTGYGYAPELDVAVGAMEVNFVLDTLGGTIGDTIEIPVMLDKDVSASYNGITYWLNGLSVDLNVTYNARSLKFLQATALAKPDDMTVSSTLGTVTITGTDIDSLSGGELARLQFLVTVPEFQQTDIAASISGFVSDSLQFLDIVPAGNTTPFVTGGKCDITVVKFSTVGTPKIEIHPNPTSNDATITFRMRESVPVDLHLVNSQGIDVRSLLDATQIFNGGEYAVRFNTMDLPAGVYFVRITAGVFSDTVPFVVVK
ncbi:MAG: T9SS C-terminal target domain-containing protein, partial [Ignavibacteriae bacterium]